jgi:hypothetical protein
MANDLVRTREPGQDFTGQATAAVTGKRFVKISGARTNKFNVLGTTADGNNYKVAPCAAGQQAIGVAKYDQPTVGSKVGVAAAGVCTVTAGAAITAGQTVMSDATGQAIPWAQSGAYPNTNVALGVAMDDCANGADAEIALFAL